MLSGTNPKAKRRAARQASRFAVRAAARAARQAARSAKRAERKQTKRRVRRSTRASVEGVSDAAFWATEAGKTANWGSRRAFLESPEGRAAIALAIGQQAERKATRVGEAEEKGGGLYEIKYLDRRIPVIAKSREDAKRKVSKIIQLEGFEASKELEKQNERAWKLAQRKDSMESFERAAERANRRAEPKKVEGIKISDNERDAFLTILSIAGPSALFGVGGKALQALRASRAARVAGTANNLSTAQKVGTTALRGVAGSKSVRAAQRVATSPAARTAAKAAPKATGVATSARRASRVAGAIRASKTAASGTRAAKVARTAGSTRAGRAAILGAKGASYPVRHPLKSAALYEAGAGAAAIPAAVQEGSLQPIGDALTGTAGAVKDAVDSVGDELEKFGVIGNAARDLLELPATLIPSTALLGAATVKAIGGDPAPLKAMLQGYIDQGFLPALAQGDLDQAVTALREHPVYSGLEVSGALAGLDRAAGALVKRPQREALQLVGGTGAIERSYSRGLTKRKLQQRADKKRAAREGGQKATPKETEKYLTGGMYGLGSGKVDRFQGSMENVRRAGRAEEQAFAEGILAKPKPKGLGQKVATANRDGVAIVSTLGIRSRAFKSDLNAYLKRIDDAYAELKARSKDRSLTPDERSAAKVKMKANRQLHDQVKLVRDHGDPEVIYASASEMAPRMRQREKELLDSDAGLDPMQAERARLVPAAQLHLGVKYDGNRFTLNGKTITTDQIKAGLRDIGVDPEGIPFITQRPNSRGGGSFYKPWYPDRQNIRTSRRTGASTFEGWDASAEAMVEQLIRTRGHIDAVRTYDHAVSTFAPKTPTGQPRGFKDGRTAQAAVRNPEEYGLDPRIGWRAIRVNPRQSRILDDVGDGPGDELGTQLELAAQWNRANQIDGAGGNFTVIPEAAAKRLDSHFAKPETSRMVLQVVNQAFKGTVLPYSPKWVLGNVADINVRMAISGQPFQQIASMNRKFADDLLTRLERIDPEGAARVKGALTPGAHMASVQRTRVVRDVRQFEATELAPVAHRLNQFREAPGMRTLVNLHTRYKNWVFSKNDQWIESRAQTAQLGKLLKQEAREKGYIKRWESVWKMGDEARDDLARGLLNTDTQLRFAEGLERVFGQWSANSPAMRALLVDFAPFGMWTRAATKFVFKTMPADHPVLTAILASSELMTLEERKALGFSFESDQPLPDNLIGGMPIGENGALRGGVAGLTSFGYFADPATAFAGAILPQASGALQSLQGLDWTGEQLTDADGHPISQQQRFLAAFTSQAEAYAPLLAIGQRVSTASEGDDAGDAALDLLFGKDLDEGLTDYLRKPKKQISVVDEGDTGSDSSYSAPDLPAPATGGFSSGYSSGSGSGVWDDYGGG